ncbi:MAG: hypothetical protein HZA93_20135 [Verrucomicrobia bacterium]|nr:hypothetical protein [Verrucomicrobiota bacterium]
MTGLAGLLAMVPSARAGVLDWLFPKHDVEVIVVTDATPVGALRRPVTPANPAYYQAVSAGYRDFGGLIAGDKIPPKDEVMKVIAKVLARQGYLPGTPAHPPSLILIWTWGTMYVERMPTGNPDDLEGRQINRSQLLRFMGAYKLGLVAKEPGGFNNDLLMPGTLFRDVDSELIYQLASEDLYVIAITAYDYAAAARNQKVQLWTTKISCPSLGLAMDQTLPAMLALAGPNIGRETAKPVSIKATDKFKPEVKIGDPTVVEYMENNQVPVIEVTPSPVAPKKKAAPKK